MALAGDLVSSVSSAEQARGLFSEVSVTPCAWLMVETDDVAVTEDQPQPTLPFHLMGVAG